MGWGSRINLFGCEFEFGISYIKVPAALQYPGLRSCDQMRKRKHEEGAPTLNSGVID